MRKILTCICLFTLILGCVSVKYGKRFAVDDVMKIQRCKTTEEKTIEMFGEPTKRGIQSGYKTLSWQYSDINMHIFQSSSSFMKKANSNTGTLIVFVNSNGIIVDYAMNPTGLVEVKDMCQK